MYYCKSRYYVPQWCRWLNGDSIGYLNPQDINRMNLFAYCNNNPVMGIDPTGCFSWNSLWKGIGLVIVGIGAVATGIVTLPFGGAISIVAGITAVAGAGTTIFGLSDIGEGISDYNIVKETIFGGNENAYNLTENIFEYTAIIGSAICGIYGTTHISSVDRKTPSSSSPHSGIWNKNGKTLTYYGGDGKMKYSMHLSKHGNPKVHSIPHWHTELPHSKNYNNFFRFLWEMIKRGF